MPPERALIGLHGAGITLALAAVLLSPRPGQAALMVPLASNDLHSVLRWADREDAALLRLDTSRGRVIARISDHNSLIRALGSGIVPVAVRAPGCAPTGRT